MNSLTLEPISKIEGEINLPGSKSLSNRALLVAALAKGTSKITNLLESDDTRHMLNALKHWESSILYLKIKQSVLLLVMADL